jgi:putative tricarboxylic transport membrane protein
MSNAKDDNSENPYLVNFNTIIGLFFIVMGIVVFLIIPYQVEQPLRLIGETTADLDPSIFPEIVATLIIFVGVLLTGVSSRLAEENDLKAIDRRMLIRVTVSLVLIFSYAFLLQPLGFVVASALIVGILSTYYGNRNLIAGAFVSLVVPLFMFNLFTQVLTVSLPPFPLDLGISFI